MYIMLTINGWFNVNRGLRQKIEVNYKLNIDIRAFIRYNMYDKFLTNRTYHS